MQIFPLQTFSEQKIITFFMIFWLLGKFKGIASKWKWNENCPNPVLVIGKTIADHPSSDGKGRLPQMKRGNNRSNPVLGRDPISELLIMELREQRRFLCTKLPSTSRCFWIVKRDEQTGRQHGCKKKYIRVLRAVGEMAPNWPILYGHHGHTVRTDCFIC